MCRRISLYSGYIPEPGPGQPAAEQVPELGLVQVQVLEQALETELEQVTEPVVLVAQAVAAEAVPGPESRQIQAYHAYMEPKACCRAAFL